MGTRVSTVGKKVLLLPENSPLRNMLGGGASSPLPSSTGLRSPTTLPAAVGAQAKDTSVEGIRWDQVHVPWLAELRTGSWQRDLDDSDFQEPAFAHADRRESRNLKPVSKWLGNRQV